MLDDRPGRAVLLFACKWLPPVWDSDAWYDHFGADAEFTVRKAWLKRTEDERAVRAVREAWNHAGGYLDRAHLVDRCLGGLDGPQNLMPLCKRCHREMPSFDDGDHAVLWVRTHEHWMARVGREVEAMVAVYGSLEAVDAELKRRAPGWEEAA